MREYVTFHPGTAVGHMKTVIGDNLFYVGSHIAHDCIVNHVILANHVNVGGHVDIGDYAYFGGNSAVHPFIRIGSHSIIGGGTAVTADVIPLTCQRAALHGLNPLVCGGAVLALRNSAVLGAVVFVRMAVCIAQTAKSERE